MSITVCNGITIVRVKSVALLMIIYVIRTV